MVLGAYVLNGVRVLIPASSGRPTPAMTIKHPLVFRASLAALVITAVMTVERLVFVATLSCWWPASATRTPGGGKRIRPLNSG